MIGTFDIEHFLPVSLHPEQERTCDNLFSACAACNALKGKSVVPDATAVLVASDVWVTEDGVIHADAPEAARLSELLG